MPKIPRNTQRQCKLIAQCCMSVGGMYEAIEFQSPTDKDGIPHPLLEPPLWRVWRIHMHLMYCCHTIMPLHAKHTSNRRVATQFPLIRQHVANLFVQRNLIWFALLQQFVVVTFFVNKQCLCVCQCICCHSPLSIPPIFDWFTILLLQQRHQPQPKNKYKDDNSERGSCMERQ